MIYNKIHQPLLLQIVYEFNEIEFDSYVMSFICKGMLSSVGVFKKKVEYKTFNALRMSEEAGDLCICLC